MQLCPGADWPVPNPPNAANPIDVFRMAIDAVLAQLAYGTTSTQTLCSFCLTSPIQLAHLSALQMQEKHHSRHLVLQLSKDGRLNQTQVNGRTYANISLGFAQVLGTDGRLAAVSGDLFWLPCMNLLREHTSAAWVMTFSYAGPEQPRDTDAFGIALPAVTAMDNASPEVRRHFGRAPKSTSVVCARRQSFCAQDG